MNKQTNQEMNAIINRINNRKEELGYSYQEFANKTGLSKSTLQRYLTGSIKNVPLDKVDVIATALETTTAYLMGWDTEEEYNKGKQDAKLVKEFNRLTDKNKQAVLNIINNLLETQSEP